MKSKFQGMPSLCFRVSAEHAKITEVVEGLFICGITSLNAENIQNYQISLIINATVEVPNARSLGNAHRLKLWLEDTPEADLYSHLDMLCDQIQEVLLQGGRVLVHCVAGVSRSSSICLAFLVKYRDMSLRQAYMHMAHRRPLVSPNLGFWKQLILFEQVSSQSS
ncbi:unnamed protein product [Toxocara canis]|uniref:Dual specificity protein phosphatase 14 n=1 Tax=Toxocara canis TaxID=6265 RepID=A0A183UZL9_TOXCA|nr:unnamed protein product [Toxocara canis]